MKSSKTHSFCLGLLDLGAHRSRAMTNYVMGLSSSSTLSSVVEIANNPFFHYSYSNYTKVVSLWSVSDTSLLTFFSKYLPPPRKLLSGTEYYALTLDFSKISKPFSPCLEHRGFHHISNSIVGGTSLTHGYGTSVVHLGVGEQGWCPPLLMDRMDVEADKLAFAAAQIKQVREHEYLGLRDFLLLLRADSYFGCAKFLSLTYANNLVNITRMRSGLKVWCLHDGEQKSIGRPRIYGDKFHLIPETRVRTFMNKKLGQSYEVTQRSIVELQHDEQITYPSELGNGRLVTISVTRWNDMLLRSKGEAKMSDKPLDILQVKVADVLTGELVFKRPMFLTVHGQRRKEVDTREVHPQYRERFDAEHLYRFLNRNLLLNAFQTPDCNHYDKWIKIVQLAVWQLFVASSELTQLTVQPWQKYTTANKEFEDKEQKERMTIAQTQKSIQTLFYTFDKEPFLPQKCKKGRGREKGTKLEPRLRHAVRRKANQKRKKEPEQQNK
jgi:hypothetical protein